MKRTISSRRATVVGAAIALLAGCGGSQPPISALGAMTQSRSAVTRAGRSESWMSPEAKSEDLLYISNMRNGTVTVYSYRTHKLVGKLTGFSQPSGLCAAKDGKVFIPDYNGFNISVYAHGATKPIRVLSDTDRPFGCAVDPTTGNLAVTNGGLSAEGNTVVYKNDKKRTPTEYTDGDNILEFESCSYDKDGDLFVDGNNGEGSGFAELPRGASTFTNFYLSESEGPSGDPGAILWDGKQLSLSFFFYGSEIFQLKMTGNQAIVQSSTSLEKSIITQYWIQPRHNRHHQVVISGAGATGSATMIGFWNYPAGGDPIATITDGIDDPFGVVVSVASRR